MLDTINFDFEKFTTDTKANLDEKDLEIQDLKNKQEYYEIDRGTIILLSQVSLKNQGKIEIYW